MVHSTVRILWGSIPLYSYFGYNDCVVYGDKLCGTQCPKPDPASVLFTLPAFHHAVPYGGEGLGVSGLGSSYTGFP